MIPKTTEASSNNNNPPSSFRDGNGSQDQAAMALKSSLQQGAQHLGDDAKHLATGLAAEAKKTAESQLARGQNLAADQLSTVAHALRKTGDELRQDDQGMLTDYVAGAADKVEMLSEYLQTRTLGQVVGDIESFARREPALFLGGSFVLGLVGGRFLKSARPARVRVDGGMPAGRMGLSDHPSIADRPNSQSDNDSKTTLPGVP